MANAPCARLMKFIRPIVTDRPMLIMNSRLPYAMPSNRTPAKFPSIANAPKRAYARLPPGARRPRGGPSVAVRAGSRASVQPSVPRVFHVLELVELDVPRLAVDHLHFAKVNV